MQGRNIFSIYLEALKNQYFQDTVASNLYTEAKGHLCVIAISLLWDSF